MSQKFIPDLPLSCLALHLSLTLPWPTSNTDFTSFPKIPCSLSLPQNQRTVLCLLFVAKCYDLWENKLELVGPDLVICS